MKDRPILFSAPMVRALLNGSKTQTRRVAKGVAAVHSRTREALAKLDSAGPRIACPYGQPGDRLWVRETFCPIYPQDKNYNGGRPIEHDYAATYKHGDRLGDSLGIKKVWKPSIHMPRVASRITLEVTSVRVERLQDISEADAVAEGIERQEDGLGWKRGPISSDHPNTATRTAFPRLAYQSLWESINGPHSWEANPWVWVIEFKRIEQSAT